MSSQAQMKDIDEDLGEAQVLVKAMAAKHYENFPVGSRFVPKVVRPHIHAVYAFARSADDFADEVQFEGKRLECLAGWRSKLFAAASGRADDPIFVALQKTLNETELPIHWLDELIQAFEQDVKQPRHPTFDSILDYASRSANPVGRIVLWLSGYRSERLFELSDAICTALQFANFWQDIQVDWKKDRIYLPQDDMKAFGYSEADLQASVCNQAFANLVQLQVDRTWELFWKGRGLCDMVGKDLRMELRLVWLGGTRILERIKKNHFDVFRHRPTIGLWDKGLLFGRALSWKRMQ